MSLQVRVVESLEELQVPIAKELFDAWGQQFLKEARAADDASGITRPNKELEHEINHRIRKNVDRLNTGCSLAAEHRRNPVLALVTTPGKSASTRSADLRQRAGELNIPVVEDPGDPGALAATLAGLEEKRLTHPKLHILEIVHDFPPHSHSGTELYTLNLARELQSRGHRVTVLHPVADANLPVGAQLPDEVEGLDVLRFNIQKNYHGPAGTWNNPSFDAPFDAILGDNDFDLVHVQHIMGLGHTWLDVIKQRGLPLAMKFDDMFFYCERFHLNRPDGTYCSEGPESLDKCFRCTKPELSSAPPDVEAASYQLMALRRASLRRAFSLPDYIHVPSAFLRDGFKRFGFENRRVEVVVTGILPFSSDAPVPEPDNRLRIAYVGTVHERKGIDDFIRAARLCLEGMDPQQRARVRFLVHGKKSGDPACGRLDTAIAEIPELEYAGPFVPDDRPRVFASVDILVMPSLGENFPFLLRESLHAGTPVIASEIAGVPEIVDDGRNGFLYPPGDITALAAIFTRLAGDPEELGRLDTDCRVFPTVPEEVDHLESVFHDLVAADPAVAGRRTYDANIEALRRSNPGVAEWILTVDDTNLYGNYVMTERTVTRHGHPIHDMDDPEGEGRRLAESWLRQTTHGPVRVMGFGMGHHLEPLLEMMEDDRGLLVQLLDRVIFQLVLRRRDLTKILGDPRLQFVSDLSPDNAHVLPGYMA